MEFFYSKDNLDRAIPEETKILSIRAETYSDGRRVKVHLEITPFQKRPNIQVNLYNAHGDEVASTSIVETLNWKLEFTMHVRGTIQNPYMLNAKVYYPDGPSNELPSYSFDIQPPQPTPHSDSA